MPLLQPLMYVPSNRRVLSLPSVTRLLLLLYPVPLDEEATEQMDLRTFTFYPANEAEIAALLMFYRRPIDVNITEVP